MASRLYSLYIKSVEFCRKGSIEMKKSKSIYIGIFSLLFYYLVVHLMLLWEYNEKYSFIQNSMLYVLPALPGVAHAILLIRNSVREFFKSWGICFLTSVCLGFLWIILRVDLMIYTSLTGFEEFSLGEGLLIAIMSMSYIISCTIGCIVAAILSFVKQKRKTLQKIDMSP